MLTEQTTSAKAEGPQPEKLSKRVTQKPSPTLTPATSKIKVPTGTPVPEDM